MEDADIRQILGDLTGRNWQGVVFRHMLGESPADRENRRGARWNPPEIPAIYTSLSKEVALAEGSFHFNMQPIAPRARRTIFRINIRLGNVLDLTDHKTLARLGLVPQPTDPWEHEFCQRVGNAVEWMGHDGMFVPSVRAKGVNLVIYPNRIVPEHYQFDAVADEVIQASSLPVADAVVPFPDQGASPNPRQ